jgi:hypothetical protein
VDTGQYSHLQHSGGVSTVGHERSQCLLASHCFKNYDAESLGMVDPIQISASASFDSLGLENNTIISNSVVESREVVYQGVGGVPVSMSHMESSSSSSAVMEDGYG